MCFAYYARRVSEVIFHFLIFLGLHCDIFQEEVLREAGEVALKLGLLVAEERNKIDNIEEMGVYCFLDTMIQQFLAANYLLILKTKEKVQKCGPLVLPFSSKHPILLRIEKVEVEASAFTKEVLLRENLHDTFLLMCLKLFLLFP